MQREESKNSIMTHVKKKKKKQEKKNRQRENKMTHINILYEHKQIYKPALHVTLVKQHPGAFLHLLSPGCQETPIFICLFNLFSECVCVCVRQLLLGTVLKLLVYRKNISRHVNLFLADILIR